VSGYQMLHEDPLQRVKAEAERFLYSMCGDGIHGGFTSRDTLWLMVAFSKHLWMHQEFMRKSFDEYMNRTVQPVMIPGLEGTEARLIKDIVAESIGSQDVKFDEPAINAVRALRDAFKHLQQQNNPFYGGKFGR
jgi:hypothetical protein